MECMAIADLAIPGSLGEPACARAQAAFAGKGNKAFDNGVASTAGAFDNILMNGQEVFKFAVRAVPTVRAKLLLNWSVFTAGTGKLISCAFRALPRLWAHSRGVLIAQGCLIGTRMLA